MVDPADRLTRESELRKLSFHHMNMIASHMKDSAWQKLMMIIPKDLNDPLPADSHSQTTKFKYTRDHLRMIEDARYNTRPPKLPGHILFEEWGTSGKCRPTLGHLIQLLIQADLYRVADYLAIDILNEGPVSRPAEGPAKQIDMDMMWADSLVSENMNLDSMINGMSNASHNSSIGQDSNANLIGNGAIVTVSDENSNGATQSTNLPSDPGTEELPFSILMQAAARTDNDSQFSRISQRSNVSAVEFSGGFQSSMPISLLGQINFGAAAEDPSQTQSTNQSTTNSSSSCSAPSSESFAEQLSSVVNHSLPDLSFFENNNIIQSMQSTNEVPTTRVEKFAYAHLQNCTNNFNNDNFTDLNSPGRKLGAGGFGSVHLATNLSAQTPMAAVKRLQTYFEFMKKKFDLEISILSPRNHENLVRLLGSSDDGGNLCLIYEYVSGGNLEQRLESCRKGERKLAIQKRLDIALGIAAGINYLHSERLAHRDVKPANVLLTDEDIPKLCDFGLVRQLNSRTTTMVVGSSGYMAPEVVRGTADYAKVDVFAFGVVQLELLTGLPVISDERREDFVTYVEKIAGREGDITPLLDKNAGDWEAIGQWWYTRVVVKAVELSSNRRSDIVECLQQLRQLCNEML